MRVARWLLARLRRPDNFVHMLSLDPSGVICARRGFRVTSHWMYTTCPECLADPRFEETCSCNHEQSMHLNGAGACQQDGYGKITRPYTHRWWCACEQYRPRSCEPAQQK